MQKTAYLQLHRICDQDCIFCAQPTNGKYLNFSEISDQIDYYILQWYTGIIFSGWEPTMSPYFFDTISYCREKNISMRILTNGHMLADADFARRSIDAWLSSYHISLHSHVETIHDAMVKKSWSYRRSLEAMTNILRLGWDLTINITINSYNVTYFPKMISFFLKNFPKIDGFIVNNLETSQITSTYFWVIADLQDIKKIIIPTLDLIVASWKEVRVERVPMCYMRWYEHLSVDVEYTILGDEKYLHYLDDTTTSGVLDSSTHSADYTYWSACKACDLKKICSGIVWIWTHYKESDLYTQKVSKDELDSIIFLSKKYLHRSY